MHHADPTPIRPHQHLDGKRALSCQCSEAEGVAILLTAGDATIHQGGTLHYSRGNSTAGNRRGFIINCRPRTMIRLERELPKDVVGSLAIPVQEAARRLPALSCGE